MVQALLEAGADPNSGFENGFTPLVAAGLSGSGESVAALLAAGADPCVAYGQPLIEVMRQQGRSNIVELLEAAIARQRAV
jgi:ankyrin repeat protein